MRVFNIQDICLGCFVLFDSLCPIINLSVIKGCVFLGLTRTELELMCLTQGHYAVMLEPGGHPS